MRKEIKTLFRIILSITSISVIAGVVIFIVLLRNPESNQTPVCLLDSLVISENELIGTWRAGVPDHSDTLIIKSDGTYKQIVSVVLANGQTIDYESNWELWYLDFSNKNIPYLHLKNYAFCGMNTDISCKVRNGGGYDFCEDERITMDGEGILLALKTSSGNYIHLHYPLGSENSYTYSSLEP